MCLGDGVTGCLPHCRIVRILKRSCAGRQCSLLFASFFFSATQSQAAAPDLPEGTMSLSNIPNLVPAGLLAGWSVAEKAGPLISHLNPLTLYPCIRSYGCDGHYMSASDRIRTCQVWLKEAQHDNSRSGEQRSASSY